jgi:hypothetical protein
MSPSILRHAQRADLVVFGMRADEFHKSDLAAEIESRYETIISSGDFEPHALAIEHFCFRRR